MRRREYYKTTPLGREEKDMSCNHILVPYPDEDLFEDGELNDNKHDLMHRISEVEYKILQMWRNDRIVIARWEDLK